jgi:hypothetical protein
MCPEVVASVYRSTFARVQRLTLLFVEFGEVGGDRLNFDYEPALIDRTLYHYAILNRAGRSDSAPIREL